MICADHPIPDSERADTFADGNHISRRVATRYATFGNWSRISALGDQKIASVKRDRADLDEYLATLRNWLALVM
jgi:hypothetical protein